MNGLYVQYERARGNLKYGWKVNVLCIVDQVHQRSGIVVTILETLKGLSRWQTHALWVTTSKIGQYLLPISGKKKRKLLFELQKKEVKN